MRKAHNHTALIMMRSAGGGGAFVYLLHKDRPMSEQ